MSRRQALAALAAFIGSQVGTTTTSAEAWFRSVEPADLTFNLRAFRSYKFTEGDRTVTVSPQELMDALFPAAPDQEAP